MTIKWKQKKNVKKIFFLKGPVIFQVDLNFSLVITKKKNENVFSVGYAL